MANSIFTVHEMINKVGFEFDESTAKKVTQLAERAGRLAADNMTQELSDVVAEIGGIFNKALAKIGKQQIDLTDMIKMPDSGTITKLTSSFVSQIAGIIVDGISDIGHKIDVGAIGDSISDGIVNGIKDASNRVEAEFDALIKKREQAVQKLEGLQANIRKREDAERRLALNYGTNEKTKYNSNDELKNRVKQTWEDFDDVNFELQDAEEAGRVTETLLARWRDAAAEMLKIKNTIAELASQKITKMDKTGGIFGKSYTINAAEDLFGKSTVDYFMSDSGEEGLFDDIEFGSSIINDFIDTDAIQENINEVKNNISELSAKIDQLTSQHPELISEQSAIEAEERINRVKEAYDRLFITRGKNKGNLNEKDMQAIHAAIKYNPKGTQIRDKESAQQALNALDKWGNQYVASAGSDWEVRAQKLVKFVKEYESLMDNPAIDQNAIAGWTDTYNKLKPMFAEYELMLRNVYDMAQGKDMAPMDSVGTKAQNVVGVTNETEVNGVNQSLEKQSNILTNIEKLTSYIDDEYLSAGKHLSDFLNDIQRESNELDDELKDILSTLNLIDENGNLTFNIRNNGEEGGGTTHKGALISDDFVLIERGDYESVKNSHLPSATQGAVKDGINVAEVLGYLPSKYNGGFFDVQAAAKGHNLFENGVLSQDVVNATDEQLEQLVQAFIKARDYGFDIENGGSNIAYDPERGFSFYDLEELSKDDAEFWNGLSEGEKKLNALENLFSLFSGLNRDHTNFDVDANVHGFAERIKQLIANKNIVAPNVVDQDGRNYEDIYDDVFSGDIDAESDDLIAQLMAEAEAHKKNAETINAETQAKEKLNNVEQYDDDAEIIQKENGALEDKLELLRDIAEEHANDITQKQRDRYEELNQKDMDSGLTSKEEDRYWELGEKISDADEALVNFGETYDKITLKLANGKKVEILPDDKGLRTFSKIADGYDGEYDGIEIEDVIFERVKKEAVDAEVAVSGLNEELKETHQLNQTSSTDVGVSAGDASSEELNEVQAEAESLRKELEVANERARMAEADAADERHLRTTTEDALSEAIGEKWSAEKRAEDAEKETEILRQNIAQTQTYTVGLSGDNVIDTNAETTQMSMLKESIDAVTTSVGLKTQAFKDEAVAVNTAIESEVAQLDELEQKVISIKNTLDGLINNINSGQSNIGDGLSNIVVNVNHAETQQNDLSPVIDAINRIQIQPAQITDVGNVLATENTLSTIKTVIESINTKVQNGITSITDNTVGVKTQSPSQNNDLSDQVDTINILLDLYKELGYQQDRLYAAQEKYDELERYSAQERIDELRRLIAMGERSINMTDLLREQFRVARESGGDGQFKSQSTKTSESAVIPYQGESENNIGQKLSEQIKTAATSLLKYKNTLQEANQLHGDLKKGVNGLIAELSRVSDKEGLTIWNEHFKQFKNVSSIIQTLVKDYQELGAMQAKADAETDPTKLTQYLDDIQILQDRIDTKLVDVNVGDNRFEEARQRAYNIAIHELQQKEELIDASQNEAEVIKQLVSLYEELGRAQARGDVNETANIRRQIAGERGKLSSVDYATDMKFKASKDKGYTYETTKIENAHLKEQKKIFQNLIALYKQLGDVQTRSKDAGDGMAVWYEDQAKVIEQKIFDEMQKIDSITSEMQDKLDESYNTGKESAESDILKTLYAQEDKATEQDAKKRQTDIANLAKKYEQLGKAQANFDQTGNLESEHEINSLKQIIAAEEVRLGLTKDQIAALESRKNIVYEEEKGALDAKQREKNKRYYEKEEEKARKEELRKQRKEELDKVRINKADSVRRKATDTSTSLNILEDVPDDIINDKVQDLNNKLKQLEETYKRIKGTNGPIDPKDSELLKRQTAETDKLTQETNELIEQYNRLSGSNTKKMDYAGVESINDPDVLRRQLIAQVQAYTQGKAVIGEFDAATGKLSYTVKGAGREVTSYTAELRGLDKQYVTTQGTTKKTEGFFQSILRKTKEIGAYFSGSSLIYKAINSVKQGIQYVREIDAALTELKKVTDETEESYERFLNTAAKTGAKIGSTISDFTQATAEFARLGYNIDLASEMAEAAIVYTNVGDGIESVSAASESIISTMKGFGMETSESMAIVDRFNEVGNRFAITSKGIGDALQRSASALAAAGNTIDESIGLVTAANTVVQDPESVGTALKTLTLRLRGAKTELEEAGLETENMAETTASLQQKLLALTGGKVDIMLDANTFKSSTQILREMATVWEDMTDIQQAAALELMGGKRQANILSSIIANFDIVEDAITTSMDSSGSAIEENEKYLDSINGKIQQFTNAVQTMWNDELGSTVIKTVVDLGTALIKVVDTLGLIPSILVAIGSFKMFQSVFKGFNLSSFVNDIKALTMGTQVLDATTRKATMSLMAEQIQFNLASSSLVQYAIKMGLATAADVGKMTTTQLLGLSFKALGVAILNTTKAMIAFLFTNPVGWAILAIGAIAGVVAIFNATTTSAKEASEQLEETKNKISDLESELESLQTQLDETRDKIAELAAIPSLSLTQQEDLDRLEREVELLERQIALKERQLAIEEAKLIEDTELAIEKNWGPTDKNKKDKKKVNQYIEEYEEQSAELKAKEDAYLKASKEIEKNQGLSYETWKQVREAQGFGGQSITKDIYEDYDWDNIDRGKALLNSLHNEIEDVKAERIDTASKIDEIFNDSDYAGLTYGMSDEINEFLDDFNNAQLKWEKALYGDNSTASAIESLWGSNASEEMKAVKSEIDKIMAEDGNWASDEEKWQSKNEKIQEYINSLDKAEDGYHQLDYAINELGVSTQQIADYFTVLNGAFNSSTVEGITKQYTIAADAITKFKDGLSVVGTDADGNEVSMNFDDLFTFDDKTKKWQADAEKVSQILKGADEQTREQFTTYITHIKNAQQEAEDAGKDFDITAAFTQASKNMEIDGLLRVIDITKESLSSINKITFQDIADEIDGLIDTFSEFGKALEDTASAMDTLYKAQEQMNSSGRISVKTALELMQSTEDWNSVLEINGDTIKLQDGAEQSLIQSRLNLIEQNINTALSEAELQYAKLEGADATLLQGDADLTTVEAQKEFDKAMNQSTAVSAGLGAAAGNLIEKLRALGSLDFDSDAWNTSITSAFTSAYDSAMTVLDEQSGSETAEEVAQRIADLRAQKDMIGQLKKNPSAFKNYYDYDKTPGDKYGEGTSDKFQKEMDYWENRIGANQAKYEQIQNEIDLLESQGKKAGKEYYEEQINLENERLSLLDQQKTAAQSMLGQFKEGSDEWFRKKPVYWETNKCNPLNCWNSLRVLYTTTQG